MCQRCMRSILQSLYCNHRFSCHIHRSLGWTEETWGQHTAKTAIKFARLSNDDRMRAEELGYDQDSWDDPDEWDDPDDCGEDSAGCDAHEAEPDEDACQYLGTLKVFQLRKRALDAGLDNDAVDKAGHQHDAKSALVELIVEFEASQLAEVRAQKVSDLRKAAKIAGFSDEEIDAATDEKDAKLAFHHLLHKGCTAAWSERPEPDVVDSPWWSYGRPSYGGDHGRRDIDWYKKRYGVGQDEDDRWENLFPLEMASAT